ncbi:NR2C2 isoform 13, partial [Pongo abelii]
MTSPSPRIQIISTDSAVASPQRIQGSEPASGPLSVF